jgi:hypothetical protein
MAEHTYKNTPPSPTGPIKQTHGFGAAVGGTEVKYTDGVKEVTLTGSSQPSVGKAGQSRGVAKKGFGAEVR